MGGLGSGRYYGWSDKTKLEDCLSLNVLEWNRKNLLSQGSVFTLSWSHYHDKFATCKAFVGNNNIFIIHELRDTEYKWHLHKFTIELVWTECNFGGKRPWFICPSIFCGKKTPKLYGNGFFVCRRCRGLAYKSQSESVIDRACRRADKLRTKLKWDLGILNGPEIKPKGMHWRRYNKLYDHHQYLSKLVSIYCRARFGQFGDYFGDCF